MPPTLPEPLAAVTPDVRDPDDGAELGARGRFEALTERLRREGGGG